MDPRYPIGEFDFPPALSAAERTAALAVLAATPAELRTLVEDLDDSQLDTPYRPGGWTVRQVVHHLPDSHLNSFVRFKLGLAEDNPTIRTYDEKVWAALPDAALPVDVSVRLLEALHERWVALLAALDEEDWQRRIHHPEWGVLRLDQLLAQYAWHSRHHLAHISSLRDRMGW